MFEDRKSVGQKLAEYERGLRYSQICPVSGCGECGTCDRCRQRRVLLAILPEGRNHARGARCLRAGIGRAALPRGDDGGGVAARPLLMFFLFAWPDYEAKGGASDYVDTFPSLAEAVRCFQARSQGDDTASHYFFENGSVVTLEGDRLITVWKSSDNGRAERSGRR
jgi:hypothetical protein